MSEVYLEIIYPKSFKFFSMIDVGYPFFVSISFIMTTYNGILLSLKNSKNKKTLIANIKDHVKFEYDGKNV